MAILLTGGLGYIGSHIASIIEDQVIIIDNQSKSNLDFKKILPSATVYKSELNKKILKKVFQEHKIDGVIHLAGFKSVSESILEPFKYFRNNVISSLELIETMSEFNINKLIFSSSATVYGNIHNSPLKENFSLNSTNPYATNKIMIEQIILEHCQINKNFKALSLRYFNPIASDYKKGLCERPLGRAENIMPILLNAIKNKKIFKIYGGDYPTHDGTCVRDYIHIKDLAQAHLLAYKKISKFRGHNPINLGLGKGLSVLELIKIFEKTNKIKIKYKISKRRKGDSASSYADNKKAVKFLDWKPRFNYVDMVKDSWDAFNKINND